MDGLSIPAELISANLMYMENVLSVFVDESGNFNMDSYEMPFYSLAFVFHNQAHDICPYIEKLEHMLEILDYPGTFVHTAPIIRGKDEYSNLHHEVRLSIFNRFMQFLNKIPYTYFFLIYDKSDFCYRRSIAKQNAQ